MRSQDIEMYSAAGRNGDKMLFSELEKFCEERGVHCVIKMDRGRGTLEDAIVLAVSDYLERDEVVDLPQVRGDGASRGGRKEVSGNSHEGVR